MAITQTYVDPAGNADSGTGTIGDPYLDLQYALDTMTQDAVNGDQINVKAGTDEVLAAKLSFATIGVGTASAPIVIRGYTSAANDGGQGGISGNATYAIVDDSVTGLGFIDMHLHNVGANYIVNNTGQYGICIRVEFENYSGNAGYRSGAAYHTLIDCYFHTSTGGRGIWLAAGICRAIGCYVDMSSGSTPIGIALVSGADVFANIIKIPTGGKGITAASGNVIYGNTIIVDGLASGTGEGIDFGGSSAVVINNIVAGFSGAGGDGVDMNSYTGYLLSNAYYNNTSHVTDSGALLEGINNDTIGSNPFVDEANDDYSINGTIAGITEDALATTANGDTTNLMDKGAAQAGAGAGGGGGGRRPRIRAHGV